MGNDLVKVIYDFYIHLKSSFEQPILLTGFMKQTAVDLSESSNCFLVHSNELAGLANIDKILL